MYDVISIVSSLSLVRDIASDPAGFVWVATEGGLFAVDEAGEVVAIDRRVRGLEKIWVQGGTLRVGAAGGCSEYQPETDTWMRSGCDERRAADGPVESPTWDGSTIFATDGSRLATVPGHVGDVAWVGDVAVVRTVEGGLFTVGARGVDPVETNGTCGNFITGLTRWNGALVLGSFDRGACREDEGMWQPISLPSTMVNEVLAVPVAGTEVLWVATAEGLVRIQEGRPSQIFVEVQDHAGKNAPGLNHAGANHLSWDGSALWVADVLGPTKIIEHGDAREWHRYRWSVSGHSYQTLAACGKSVWAGSEDDGLAVRGVELGSQNGRSDWHHVNALDGLPEDWIMATACDGPRAAWVGTYQNGVGRVDVSGWHPITGLETAWVQTLAVDGDTLWVGTADGAYRVRGGTVDLISTEDVWAILPEGDALILGTRTGIVTLRVE